MKKLLAISTLACLSLGSLAQEDSYSTVTVKPISRTNGTISLEAAEPAPIVGTVDQPGNPAAGGTDGSNEAVPQPGGAVTLTGAPVGLLPGVEPGKPVPVYETLQQAAEAGVDPLGELKIQGKELPPDEAPLNEADIYSLDYWLTWIQNNQTQALKVGGGTLGLLLAAWLFLRRLAARAD